MKATLGVFALLSAPVAFAEVIPAGGWGQVYGELMQCIQGMGHCRDAAKADNPADLRIELGHHSKEECTGNSLMFWVEPYSSMMSLKSAVEARDAENVATELVLVRRAADATPISTAVSSAFEASAPGSAQEGYVRCGDSEYIYVTTTDKAALYAAVNAAGSGMDVAIPVPMDLRISPWVTLYLELNPQEVASQCKVADSPSQYASLESYAHTEAQGGLCSWDFAEDGTVGLKIRLPSAGGRTLKQAADLAATFEKNLLTHGRHLVTGETPSVSATGTNHLLVQGVDRTQARNLATSALLGNLATWIELETKYELTNFATSTGMQSGMDHMQTGVETNSTDHSGATFPLDDPVLTPFYAANITGKGQVVGVGDSGIHTDSCYFLDSDVPEADSVNRPLNVTKVNYVYENHRKLTNVYAYADGRAEPAGDHGTHVSGTVAGDVYGPMKGAVEAQLGAQFVANRGIAFDAKISFFDIGYVTGGLDVPDDVSNDYLQIQYDSGARIQTNSWGTRFGNYYSSTTRHFDSFSYAHQDFVALVATGNSDFHRGSTGSAGSPAVAKNVISVGASINSDEFWRTGISSFIGQGRKAGQYKCEDYSESPNAGKCQDSLAPFTSGGPTFDHRVLPDVVAPGFFTLSVQSAGMCALTFMAGTSMATPAVAGGVALVRQYLMEGFHVTGEKNEAAGFVPMGALLKAIVVNSGKDMSGSYSPNGRGNDMENTVMPNMEYGFGLVQLDRTLVLKNHNDDRRSLFVDGDMANMPSVETGAAKEYVFNVLDGAREDVKITLVWHDPEAMESSRVALVNDLDLEVVTSDGAQYFPNSRRTRDNINNVEQVVLGGVTSSFTVTVRGYSVPMGPQPYALVVSRYAVVKATAAPTDASKAPTTASPTSVVVKPVTTIAPTAATAPVDDGEASSSDPGALVGGLIGFAIAGVLFGLYKCFSASEVKATSENPEYDPYGKPVVAGV